MAEDKTPNILGLDQLAEGIPALTPALGIALAEAASVCLEQQGHSDICSLEVRHENELLVYSLHRLPVFEPMRRAYRDLQEATELGACGIAILAARDVTGWVAIERSVRGTGFDYWLGRENLPASELEPLERKARLEVSGILRGEMEAVEARIRGKIQQTQRSAGDFAAYVIVVEFSRPGAWIQKDE